MADFEQFNPSFESTQDQGPSTASEKSSEGREQISAAFHQAQQQLARAKKDEQKTKRREKSLADLLSKFIRESDDEQLTNTLISLLKQDVSAEFVLGILSLYFPNLEKAIYEDEQEMLKDNPRLVLESRQLTMTIQPQIDRIEARDFDENNLPPEVKEKINTWVKDMMYTSFLHPQWLLPRVFINNQINSTCVQLVTFILIRFLERYHIQGEYEKVRQFGKFILSGVLRETAKKVSAREIASGSV